MDTNVGPEGPLPTPWVRLRSRKLPYLTHILSCRRSLVPLQTYELGETTATVAWPPRPLQLPPPPPAPRTPCFLCRRRARLPLPRRRLQPTGGRIQRRGSLRLCRRRRWSRRSELSWVLAPPLLLAPRLRWGWVRGRRQSAQFSLPPPHRPQRQRKGDYRVFTRKLALLVKTSVTILRTGLLVAVNGDFAHNNLRSGTAFRPDCYLYTIRSASPR